MSSPYNDSAKLFFFYVILYVSLGMVVWGSHHIISHYIDLYFPDPNAISSYAYEMQNTARGLRIGITQILVGAPLLFLSFILINRGLWEGNFQASSAVRRWGTYIILSINTTALITAVYFTISGFLEGKGDIASFLTLIEIICIALLTVVYFTYDIKRSIPTPKGQFRLVSLPFWVLILGVLALGIKEFPPLEEIREKASDTKTLRALQDINESCDRYYRTHKKLPESIQDLLDENMIYQGQLETGTEGAVDYEIVDAKSFKLCATFKGEGKPHNPKWQYKPGRQCFDLKVRVD